MFPASFNVHMSLFANRFSVCQALVCMPNSAWVVVVVGVRVCAVEPCVCLLSSLAGRSRSGSHRVMSHRSLGAPLLSILHYRITEKEVGEK